MNALLAGEPVSLGGKPVEAFTPQERRMLSVLTQNTGALLEEKGAELAKSVLTLFAAAAMPVGGSPSPGPSRRHQWKLWRLRVCSFRGLAPAGCPWQHDFAGRSHLFFGPNGSGKSSLLGAVAWCLTGQIYRDDRPPSPPEDVTVYTTGRRTTVAGTRPDALTLTDSDGASSPMGGEYWVELMLVRGDGGAQQFQWLRRHGLQGLSRSADGSSWETIASIEEAGVDELDAELRILMPARAPYIRFGKDSDLIPLFSQVVGLDDLERIADLAAKSHAALTREANRLEKAELPSLASRVAESAEHIGRTAPPSVRSLASYPAAVSLNAPAGDVAALGRDVEGLIARGSSQLASDLGLDTPPEGSVAADAFRAMVGHLPGQAQAAAEALTRPLPSLFPTSLGFGAPSEQEYRELVARLDDFEAAARTQADERLEWALREAADTKLALNRYAAAYLLPGDSSCPVCAQDLRRVPDVLQALEALRPVANLRHLQQGPEDLERALITELDCLIPQRLRDAGHQELPERVLSDWQKVKELRFAGLLQPLAERFDAAVRAVAEGTRGPEQERHRPIGDGYHDRLPGVFQRLDGEVRAARGYLHLLRSVIAQRDALGDALARCLTEVSAPEDSLLSVLRRGRAATELLEVLDALRREARELFKAHKQREVIASAILRHKQAAEATEAPKGLGSLVRQEVTSVMKVIEPRMRALYGQLYRNDRLMFDTVTTGHAANPAVKSELNAYLRSGDERIPVAPYSNAGRLRALTLSFCFALMEKSSGSLGLLILDDPALSLDDDHKARMLDHLVRPLLDQGQVILATHYEKFFKLAEPVFADAERLQLAPRRTCRDVVAFEPSDLLQRLMQSLRSPSCSWREAGVNLRRWAERVLHTLSGYCPEPFVVFNDIPASVNAYAGITDPRIATAGRDEILKALRSPQFERVMHRLAHDEEPTETETRDGVNCLRQCRKHADAEIQRLKELYRHEVQARPLELRPDLDVLPLPATAPDFRLRIAGAAAAAHNGVGVTWEERAVSEVAGLGIALCKSDTLAPITMTGQYLLLDGDEALPGDQDLALVETEAGERYLRRVWSEGQGLHLEATNPVKPFRPVKLRSGLSRIRRLVGVLFSTPSNFVAGQEGQEWAPVSGIAPNLWKGAVGVRVIGTSLEPVARDGQIVIVRHQPGPLVVGRGALACVDIQGVGAVLKRCYPSKTAWTLTPVNPVDVEEPMHVPVGDILRVHPLIGVLFKLSNERELPETEESDP